MQLDAGRILLRSLRNFRDLGGKPLGNRRLRTGLFYRSPRPTGLARRDIEWLERCRVAAIIDFRGVVERETMPAVLGDTLMARRTFMPVEPSVAARLRQLEAKGRLDSDAADIAMVTSYRAYVSNNLDTFGAFLRTCGEAEGAVVFHCSAGKDRTGFAAALLLSALGASWKDIMADYLRTRTDWQVPDDIRAEAEGANRSALLGVEPRYLEAAFEELDSRAGGAEVFAKTCLGGAQALETFRERVSVAET